MPLTVSVRLARVILAVTAVHGGDVQAVAKAAGFDTALLEDGDARLPLPIEEALWREAARATGIDAIGIAAAELVQPGMFDVLDYAVRSSANAAEALARFIRLNRLEHDAATFSVERVDAGVVRVVHRFHEGRGTAGRHLAEFTLAGILVAARQCTEEPLEPREVHLRSALPADVAPYARLFAAPVRFDEDDNALVIDERILALPFRRADSALCAILERHADALLAKLPPIEASLADRVRALVTAELRGGDPGIASIAARLHMSDRTLQRRLAADGESFDGIVDELRAALAQRYLDDRRLSIGNVAFLLGYSEPSAFHRAFKRWTGRTPGEHRNADLPHVSSAQGERTMPRRARPRIDPRRRKN